MSVKRPLRMGPRPKPHPWLRQAHRNSLETRASRSRRLANRLAALADPRGAETTEPVPEGALVTPMMHSPAIEGVNQVCKECGHYKEILTGDGVVQMCLLCG